MSARERKLQSQLYKEKLEIEKLKQELTKARRAVEVKRQNETDYVNIQQDPKKFNFLTGISKPLLFEWLLSVIKPHVEQVKKSFSLENHLLIVFMKLKLGHMNKDLALRFNIAYTHVSMIIRGWLPPLAKILRSLIVWPEREALRANLPSSFKSFKNCVCIIDCTEVFIESPLNLTARAQTYSN